MRKNKMMRTAAVLGVAALLTTSALSGTLAKYTTTAEGTDSARVAKWGVTITMANDNSAFKSTYTKDANETYGSISNTVEAKTGTESSKDMVVAPGTSGETTFSIKGTPEVAFKLDVAVDSTSSVKVAKETEVVMPAGAFEDTEIKVKPSADYEPIKFTLSKKTNDTVYEPVTKSGDGQSGKAENMTLAELEKELEDLSTSYTANTPVDAEYKISWKWDFETNFNNYASGEELTSTYTNADILDTYLGNQTGENVQKEAYKITITATQID